MRKILFLLLASSVIGGCANLGVEPWQRDVLARPEVSLDVRPPLEASLLK